MTSPAQMREMLVHVMNGTSLVPDSDLSRYAVDGLSPKAAVFPASEEELSALLKEANEKRWAVAPRGSGNAVRLGSLPERLDIVVGTEMLPHLINHNPGDLTVSIGAGTRFGLLQERLAEQGQWLPLDPPLAGRRTVGGILAANLPGPLSLSYGAARDFVLGVRIASADGTVTKSGGNVVKNVTGFDLPKLHIGALGTLGIILQATFKVLPLPKEDVTLTAEFDDLGEAVDTCHQIADSEYTAQAIDLIKGSDGRNRIYARFLGSSPSVEVRLEKGKFLLEQAGAGNVDTLAQTEARTLWDAVTDFGWNGGDEEEVLLSLGHLPSKTNSVIGAVSEYCAQNGYTLEIAAGPARGVVKCKIAAPCDQMRDVVSGLRSIASSVDGYALVEQAPLGAKAELDVWGDPGPALHLMRRLKDRMDPNRILNPGRYVGGI